MLDSTCQKTYEFSRLHTIVARRLRHALHLVRCVAEKVYVLVFEDLGLLERCEQVRVALERHGRRERHGVGRGVAERKGGKGEKRKRRQF